MGRRRNAANLSWSGNPVWAAHPYAIDLLRSTACARRFGDSLLSPALGCQSSRTENTHGEAHALGPIVPASSNAICQCGHGAHMLPFLVRRYGARTLVEVGVCTGMSSFSVLDEALTRAAPLERYYLVDPWGSRVCRPGCGCSKRIGKVAAASFPELSLLRGYSVPMAARVPNGTLDLAFIDAAHDYRNVRADVLAYWPKLKPSGVMAGAHRRQRAPSVLAPARRGPAGLRRAVSPRRPRFCALPQLGGGGAGPAHSIASHRIA
jgi:predicted O-methyltransferase YrrM